MNDFETDLRNGTQAFRGGIAFDESRSEGWRKGWMIGKSVYGTETPSTVVVEKDSDGSLLLAGAIGLGLGLFF